MNGKLGVVVVAAGKGKRMGTAESKQYLALCGKPILVHTLEVFQHMQTVDSIVLVVGEGEEARCRQYAQTYGLSKVTHVVTGGSERQSSVLKGLRAMPEGVDWVMVHDGVRPLVRPEDADACWTKAKETGEAAVLAVPVKDTIKVVGPTGQIQSTPDRSSLWAIHTPQAFRLSALLQAHIAAEREGFLGTDDAMLMERLGVPVHVVESSYDNIKVTTPEDLAWAEYLLRKQGRGED